MSKTFEETVNGGDSNLTTFVAGSNREWSPPSSQSSNAAIRVQLDADRFETIGREQQQQQQRLDHVEQRTSYEIELPLILT